MYNEHTIQPRKLSKYQIMLNSMNQSCCQSSAEKPNNRFCNDCGKALDRCAAFEECGGLLDEEGKCSSCFAPKLALKSGQANRANVGDTLTLSLGLSNHCSAGRTVYVEGVWYRKGRDDWQPCQLGWDRIEANGEKTINLIIDRLHLAGSHRIELVIAMSSRWKWREEVFAYSAGVEVRVESEKETVVQQNINYAADAPQTGATIYAPIRITQENQDFRIDDSQATRELPLVRAHVYEREFGWRGTRLSHADPSQSGRVVSVRRDAVFQFKGFSDRLAPDDSPLPIEEGCWTFGRSRSKKQNGPTDVQLLVFQADGKVDEQVSIRISRDHFCIWVQNGRLMLRSNNAGGVIVDSKQLGLGETIELSNGSVISPLAVYARKLQIKVVFELEHDEVARIQVQRMG